MNIQHLPTDLILEIISRLPAKSVARCRCVSKLWASLLTLGSPYFTELFLTQSKTRPQLLFVVQGYDKWLLYSCPRPQISYISSPLSVTAEFHMSLPKDSSFTNVVSISSLIYCPNIRNNKGFNQPVLCNPSTGQILWLPEFKVRENGFDSYEYDSYVGYDPIDKQFSVVASTLEFPFKFKILKIGSTKQLFWRNLECPIDQQHIPTSHNTYLNGVLYYIADLGYYYKIVCFDCKSEEFKFIDEPWGDGPIVLDNFKGKLCGIMTKWLHCGPRRRGGVKRYDLELSLWILKDFEKQEWSQQSYRMPSDSEFGNKRCGEGTVYVIGVTATGDIVLFLRRTSPSFYVYFFSPEKNTLQKIEIKGLEEFTSNMIYGSVNHVEDLRIF